MDFSIPSKGKSRKVANPEPSAAPMVLTKVIRPDALVVSGKQRNSFSANNGNNIPVRILVGNIRVAAIKKKFHRLLTVLVSKCEYIDGNK